MSALDVHRMRARKEARQLAAGIHERYPDLSEEHAAFKRGTERRLEDVLTREYRHQAAARRRRMERHAMTYDMFGEDA